MTRTNQSHFLIVIGLALIALALTDWTLHQLGLPWYFTWLIFWSVVTFLYYGFDKQQARQGKWRVPEFVLHCLALVGGFIGGWLGMLVFRHKNRKPVFVLVLLTSTIAHALLYVGWLR